MLKNYECISFVEIDDIGFIISYSSSRLREFYKLLLINVIWANCKKSFKYCSLLSYLSSLIIIISVVIVLFNISVNRHTSNMKILFDINKTFTWFDHRVNYTSVIWLVKNFFTRIKNSKRYRPLFIGSCNVFTQQQKLLTISVWLCTKSNLCGYCEMRSGHSLWGNFVN